MMRRIKERLEGWYIMSVRHDGSLFIDSTTMFSTKEEADEFINGSMTMLAAKAVNAYELFPELKNN